jgi:hypothetical protein
MKIIDRTGIKYGDLVILSRAPNKSEKDTNARWNYRCVCGNEGIAYGGDLQRGKSWNCGCARKEKEAVTGRNTGTHKMSKTNYYRNWQAMINRCEKPYDEKFHRYGARGITVCEEWHTFENFMNDMGFPGHGKSLDRKDNDKGYSKENCRWADARTQANNRRNSVKYEHNGLILTATEWSRLLEISLCTFRERVQAKFPPEKLFSPNLKMKA